MEDDEFDSDDDDLFTRASNHVQYQTTNINGIKLPDEKMLSLYGLYKVATIGVCDEPKPGLFNLRGKAKWNAWKSCPIKNSEEAKELYSKKVMEYYSWVPEDNSDERGKGGSSFGGNSVSTFAKEEEDEIEDESIFAWAKDNCVQEIRSYLEDGNDPNLQDEEGRTPLHWAADRGHLEACKILLEFGANPNLRDSDGSDSLEYATTCEHTEIINILTRHLS